jgi:hypothetical protein
MSNLGFLKIGHAAQKRDEKNKNSWEKSGKFLPFPALQNSI